MLDARRQTSPPRPTRTWQEQPELPAKGVSLVSGVCLLSACEGATWGAPAIPAAHHWPVLPCTPSCMMGSGRKRDSAEAEGEWSCHNPRNRMRLRDSGLRADCAAPAPTSPARVALGLG